MRSTVSVDFMLTEFINDKSTASYVIGLDHVLLANAVGFSLRRGPKAWTSADWSNLESVASDRSRLEETPNKITVDVQDRSSFGPTHGGGSGGGGGGQGSSWMI
uniref:Uncharacterized protein n=1 Tax=Globodera rostochiensis TaxID=31243 RepID=A0A914I3G7_GLORO